MGRGSKFASNQARKKTELEKIGSEESDEDYMVGEDEEFDNSEDDCCSSLDEDESEECPEELEEELEEHEGKKVKMVCRHIRRNVNEVTKMKVGRPTVRTARIVRGKEKKRNVKAVKMGVKKMRKRRNVLGSSNRSGVGKELRNPNPVAGKKKKITGKYRGRRMKVNSGSDFLSTRSSDHYDYTISEEEREQVRESAEFCRRLSCSLRSSSLLNLVKHVEIAPSQIKHPVRMKGKEKFVDEKMDVGKRVCGICLSEEGKRSVRGTLNCCSHYFCFSCIMEWSKVESRCPLCKKRFATISGTARLGSDLRSIISVPEKDQVYQPSEEELRSYFDPYENVVCTECQEGGDDALMLLCDLCDSPAHTYCVGLGHEVPEGNWYCDGCKPTALAASNAQVLSPALDTGGNFVSSSCTIARETFDPNELRVPEPLSTQVTCHSPSHRHYNSDFHTTFPASGPGAFTLSERRRIQRQIHQFFNNRNRHYGVDQDSGSNLLGSHENRDVVTPQHTLPTRVAQHINAQERLPEYLNTSVFRSEVFSPRFNLMGPVLNGQASASVDYSIGGLSPNEFVGINARMFQGFSNLQSHTCSSRLSGDSDNGILPSQFKQVAPPSPVEKEQVQSMVKSHLKSLSRNFELGYHSFKEIARTSTHTILAAVGIEHRWNLVYPARTRPLSCEHFESRQKCPVRGQCSSCFDWFVGNVVKEVMYNRVSLVSVR